MAVRALYVQVHRIAHTGVADGELPGHVTWETKAKSRSLFLGCSADGSLIVLFNCEKIL